MLEDLLNPQMLSVGLCGFSVSWLKLQLINRSYHSKTLLKTEENGVMLECGSIQDIQTTSARLVFRCNEFFVFGINGGDRSLLYLCGFICSSDVTVVGDLCGCIACAWRCRVSCHIWTTLSHFATSVRQWHTITRGSPPFSPFLLRQFLNHIWLTWMNINRHLLTKNMETRELTDSTRRQQGLMIWTCNIRCNKPWRCVVYIANLFLPSFRSLVLWFCSREECMGTYQDGARRSFSSSFHFTAEISLKRWLFSKSLFSFIFYILL